MKKNVENSMKPIAIRIYLHKLLSLEELLQVAHLPHASDDQNGQLLYGPPEDALDSQKRVFYQFNFLWLIVTPV